MDEKVFTLYAQKLCSSGPIVQGTRSGKIHPNISKSVDIHKKKQLSI